MYSVNRRTGGTSCCAWTFKTGGKQDEVQQHHPPQSSSSEEEDGPEMPVVDTDVQNELMSMDPLDRLSSIDELLQQAQGEKLPEGEQPLGRNNESSNMDVTPASSGWFQCDVHNLRILRAITLEGLGQSHKALEVWEQAVAFCEDKLLPADESLVVVRIQAALCALQAGERERARQHAQAALQTHQLLFGGGVQWFRRRCRGDLELPLRPVPAVASAGQPVDVLWPIS